jgi:hypothetical protein
MPGSAIHPVADTPAPVATTLDFFLPKELWSRPLRKIRHEK